MLGERRLFPFSISLMVHFLFRHTKLPSLANIVIKVFKRKSWLVIKGGGDPSGGLLSAGKLPGTNTICRGSQYFHSVNSRTVHDITKHSTSMHVLLPRVFYIPEVVFYAWSHNHTDKHIHSEGLFTTVCTSLFLSLFLTSTFSDSSLYSRSKSL